MTTIWLISMLNLLAAGSSAPVFFAQTLTESWRGYFVTSVDESAPRDVSVEVDIFSAYEGQGMFIDFMIKRRVPEKILGGVSPATDVSREQFTFSFIDNDGNRGRGTFSRKGTRFAIRLERAGTYQANGPSTDLYGDYELVRQDTTGRSDRHPWSLKKPPPQRR